jgi:hypothetical protein
MTQNGRLNFEHTVLVSTNGRVNTEELHEIHPKIRLLRQNSAANKYLQNRRLSRRKLSCWSQKIHEDLEGFSPECPMARCD